MPTLKVPFKPGLFPLHVTGSAHLMSCSRDGRPCHQDSGDRSFRFASPDPSHRPISPRRCSPRSEKQILDGCEEINIITATRTVVAPSKREPSTRPRHVSASQEIGVIYED